MRAMCLFFIILMRRLRCSIGLRPLSPEARRQEDFTSLSTWRYILERTFVSFMYDASNRNINIYILQIKSENAMKLCLKNHLSKHWMSDFLKWVVSAHHATSKQRRKASRTKENILIVSILSPYWQRMYKQICDIFVTNLDLNMQI